MRSIVRFNETIPQEVVFTNSVLSTGGFNMNVFAGGMLLVTSTSTNGALTLTFLTKNAPADVTPLTVADATNAPVTMIVQPGRAYALPDVLFSANYVMATTASGVVFCTVLLKS